MSTLDLLSVVDPTQLAREIASQFDRWNMLRQSWLMEMTDLRNTIFASDISTTTNRYNQDVFFNRTVIPKLTQIYDNLIANYDASIFSNEKWFEFESVTEHGLNNNSSKKITNYIAAKCRQCKFRTFTRELLSDWILYGNCFVGLEYISDYAIDSQTNKKMSTYIGPKPFRISPLDIVFNLNSKDFNTSPKILRTLKGLGEIKKEIETRPDQMWTKELYNKLIKNRQFLTQMKQPVTTLVDDKKTLTLIADGFNTIWDYYNSGLVEILEYFGDLYLPTTGEFFPSAHIVVVDRAYIIYNKPINSYTGFPYIYHCGWRQRPDNLYAMSPLANLVGMQHRIDKLENTKADVWDQIAYPITKEKGDVEYYDGKGILNGARGTPGGVYRMDQDGDVEQLMPDTTALQADTQIQMMSAIMEELAGAPKNTMGIRTPGEKTMFEVQSLDNSASRIFQHKIAYFEEQLLEPLLNGMLELARRNLNAKDIIKVTHDTLGVDTFVDITKEDLNDSGTFHAVGSRHFAQKAFLVQNINAMLQNQFAVQLLNPHIDRLQLGKVMEDLLGVDEFDLIRENVGVEQDIETKRIQQQGVEQLQMESSTPASINQPSVQKGVGQSQIPQNNGIPQ